MGSVKQHKMVRSTSGVWSFCVCVCVCVRLGVCVETVGSCDIHMAKKESLAISFHSVILADISVWAHVCVLYKLVRHLYEKESTLFGAQSIHHIVW